SHWTVAHQWLFFVPLPTSGFLLRTYWLFLPQTVAQNSALVAHSLRNTQTIHITNKSQKRSVEKITKTIKRGKPELLISLPRLIARLPSHSHSFNYLTNRLYRVQAGFAGEEKVDRYLEATQFPEPVRIFTDITLQIKPLVPIQIDTLIISPSKIIILEIKNIAGDLIYHQNPPHFECIYEDGKTIVIDCPMMQIENTRTVLDHWLAQNGFPIKSEALIVMVNSNTLIKNAPPTMPIHYGKHLPLYFRKQTSQKPLLTKTQLEKLTQKLHQQNKPFNPYPLSDRFQVDKTHIRDGFLCGECHSTLRKKTRIKWTCPTCQTDQRNPYREGLQDWFMIMNQTISNAQCREFFQLETKFAAHHILKSMPLKREGQSRATIYSWDYTKSPSEIVKGRRRDSTLK
ncbi:nuclease-related domain-containing protein, partial [Sporosarcina sp. CAU 1771]